MRRGDDGGEPQAEAQAAEAPVAEELPATAQGEPSAASTEPVQQRQQARAPHLSPAPPPHLSTRAQVEEAMGDMLAKVSRYLAGEVELSLEDYRAPNQLSDLIIPKSTHPPIITNVIIHDRNHS